VDNSITLEEFQAKLKAEREAAAEKFGAVSEKTVDASEFSGGRVRNKKDEVGEDFLAAAASARGEAKKAAKGKGQRSSTKQAFVDVGFRAPAIERGESGGRGRGGRGGDREGGGRGGRGGRGRGSGDDRPQRAPRQYNNNRGGGGGAEQHVDVNDESSFPKL
jgi:plasminogen activator inhibitor 1 RNA-binding protein